jgi:ABC-type Zn2+ transport system substrate-binding protein/surface adhesin|tara:strand:- start:15529 stop:15879 length:351 start_codon:yes stop_codon:yes gene_type:complete
MSDDDLDNDDLERDEDSDVDDSDEAEDRPTSDHNHDDDGDGDDDSDTPVVKSRKKAAPKADPLEGLSVEAKEREREMLALQMEEFMARGGKVQEVGANVVADPPKKPQGKYGSRPI